MRITFFGKGGSGKTTLSTSFIKFLKNSNLPALAIDADINVNLHAGLGLKSNLLGDQFDEVANFLEPIRSKTHHIIGSTPPTNESYFIKPRLSDQFLQKFATTDDKISLLTVGTYSENSVGYECYHSKLGVIFLIYNRLLDDKNFYVVADATAGVDSVGTSMFSVSDLNIFVVEPTLKSINVYLDFLKITKNYDLNTYVLANKIQDSSDIEFISSKINPDSIIGYIKSSPSLKAYEQGDVSQLNQFILENQEINQKILNLLNSQTKNWDTYRKTQQQIYLNECKEWYSDYYKTDLSTYIDKKFRYEDIISNA